MAHRAGARPDGRHAARFDPEDWLRLVDTLPGDVHLRGAHAHPHGLLAAGRGEGRYDRSSMKRMVANAAPWCFALKQPVPGRLPGRLAVGGLRLDRARGELHPRAAGPAAQAGIVREAGAAASRSAVRRRRQRGHRDGPEPPGRAVRPSARRLRRLLQAARPLPRRQPGGLADRGRRRLPRRRGLLLHLRSQEGHDHLGRHEHLSGRDRGRARAAPGHLRGRGVRHPERGVG